MFKIMAIRWFEIRVSLEKDELTREVISSTFQNVVLPLYKHIISFQYIRRGHYFQQIYLTSKISQLDVI